MDKGAKTDEQNSWKVNYYWSNLMVHSSISSKWPGKIFPRSRFLQTPKYWAIIILQFYKCWLLKNFSKKEIRFLLQNCYFWTNFHFSGLSLTIPLHILQWQWRFCSQFYTHSSLLFKFHDRIKKIYKKFDRMTKKWTEK